MIRDKSLARARAYPFLAACIIGAGLALRWPCLDAGFFVDDYLQLAILEGIYPVERSALALYTFANGDPAQNQVLRDAGLLTWWSDPGLRIAMFRPLSCALLWLDHALFGLDAFSYHLHGAAWWLAMAGVLAALFRRVLPPWIALLALLLFVADEAHTVLLGWTAMRNATVASAFALLGLWAQVRHRQDGWRPGPLVALVSHTLALAAGEYALAFVGYAILYELFQSRTPRAERVRTLAVPVGLLLAAYFGARLAFGAGTSGSGMYLHPLAAPLEFARMAPVRFALLAADLVMGLPAAFWTWGLPGPSSASVAAVIPPWVLAMTGMRGLYVALAALCTVAGLWIGRAGLRAASAARLADVRWLVLGTPLAIAPVVASFPEGRLLVPALVGWSVLPAILLGVRMGARGGAGWRHALATAAAGAFVLYHLAIPIGRARGDAELAAHSASAARRSILAPQLDSLLQPGTRVLLFGAADATTTIYGRLVRELNHRPAPSQWHLLASTFAPQRLERLSPSSFVLERMDADHSAADSYAAFFNDRALHAGQRFAVSGVAITVERVDRGRPMRTRYELDVALEHPSLVFLTQTTQGLRTFALPAIGQSSIVPPPFPALELR
jgi:hypothetical protein